jgi:hypothetical protein
MSRRLMAGILAAAAMLLVAPAFASASGVVWKADVLSATRVSPGQQIEYMVALENVGVAPSDGTGALDIALPTGITGVSLASGPVGSPLSNWTCGNPAGAASVHCDLAGVVAAGGQPERVYLLATAGSGVSGLQRGSVGVSGGGAAGSVSSGFSTSVSATPSFGVPGFDGSILNQDGTTDTQAGSHPYVLTTTLGFNSRVDSNGAPLPDGNVKDIAVNLPSGLVGDPTAIPQCPQQDLQDVLTFRAGCPAASQVGFITLRMKAFAAERYPVFNMVPPPGEPAQFGAFLNGVAIVYIDARVRTGDDYGLTASLSNVPTLLPLVGSTLTLWGVPADPSHDSSRGDFFQCFGDFVNVADSCFGGGQSAGGVVKPFLTLPTSCGGPQGFSLSADSWQSPGRFANGSFLTHDGGGRPVGFEGCNRLDFSPSILARPDTSSADSPSGLSVDLHIPQAGLQVADGLMAANLKKAVVALPAGFSLNPSSANGLAACSPAQIALSSPDPGTCPDASKIGSVEVDTPLLAHPLLGGVYLASQGDNPFGSLLAIYAAVADPQSGVVVKLAGHVVADPQTGQLTTTFDNNPKLPFSDFKLSFFGGQRAALATPQSCGVFQTASEMTPWSALDPGNPTPGETVSPSDSFAISSAPGGGACAGSLPFAPSFVAGTVSNDANGFSPLSVSFSRQDGEQGLGGVSVQMPPGLLGMLSSVPLCGEPAASEGSCPASSQIGHTTVSAGVGSDPVVIPQAGGPQAPVFLTGPYKGAPFGLSIVVPAVAGPFNLGNVVVRAAIGVDPHTAQVTITSDSLPTILQGIPLRVRKVTVLVDRPGFIFNPTSCNPLAVNGTITGVQGATAGVSSRFQAANCGQLPFSPKFSASTKAKTSRANGASLDAKILIGVKGEANAHVVAVQLPKQLPSRLTTIQKACLDSVFNANPAACPAASLVGTATAVTPVLPVPLSGPAYLVSHGGAGFPDIVIVLQGDGVRFDLVGSINISSKGITSSKFASAPDAPIDSFELKLPQGPHSILTGNGSLCAKPLIMPTTITGYNNKQVKQQTRVKVTGCPKAKKTKKVTHKKHKAKAKRNAKAKRPTAGRRS